MSINTIVLRFSDYQSDTIAEHLKVITERTFVYWGWWKKFHEPGLDDELTELRAHLPLNVGLLDRDQAKFYEARCTDIVVGGGRSIPTPDPDGTPDYYRDQIHPAWFRFEALVALDEGAFRERYLEIPTGDRTAFLVGEPVSTWSPPANGSLLVTKEAAGQSILHLSDLHFGEMHGFKDVSSNDPVASPCLLDMIVPTIGAVEPPIGVVVVTGDLITKGNANYFAQAERFLDRLATKLGLDHDHVVVVPGNHDLWIQDHEHATTDYSHENPYRMFYATFYGRAMEEIEGVWQFLTPEGWEYIFCAMNSARPRSPQTANYGYVGRDRVEPLLRTIEALDAQAPVAPRRLRFGLLHHHLLPAPMVEVPEADRPVSLTLDAGQLTTMLAGAGVEFCLHGHQHLPVMGTVARARQGNDGWGHISPVITVLGCGSTGGAVNVLQDEKRENTFGIYTATETGMQIRVWEYNSTVEPRLLFKSTLPWANGGTR